MDTIDMPDLLYCKPAVDNYREASVQLLQGAQSELANLIMALNTQPVDFAAVEGLLVNFMSLKEGGVWALRQYAGVAECIGSG